MKKMSKVATILSIAAILLSISSCTKDFIDELKAISGISFTEEINGMSTKATDTAFDNGDKISVTAYSESDAVYAKNVEYTYYSAYSKFTSTDPIEYSSAEGNSSLSFRAIYPYVELSEEKMVSFTIESNQSVDDAYTASDLMSSYVELTSEESPKLTFSHILTKMVFNITAADVDTTDAFATVYTPTTVNYSIAYLSSTATNDASAVTMASNGDNSFKAIVLPQTYDAGATLGVMTIGGEEYKIVLNSSLTIKAGVQYNYSLTIADGTVTFNDPIVEGWTEDYFSLNDDEDDTVVEDPEVDEDSSFDTGWEETSQYYVDTISALNNVDASDLEVGQVVVLKDGTYENSTITLDSSGTSSKPFRVRAETPGGVILTGSSRLDIRGNYIEVSGLWFQNPTNYSYTVRFYSYTNTETGVTTRADNCKLINCAITGSNGLTESDSKGVWVSIYGINNTIENCTFIDKKNLGCTLVSWYEDSAGTPSHTIKNCYFTRPNTVCSDEGAAQNEQEIIRIGESDYSMNDGNCIVEGNYFYQCHGELAECISSKLCNNEFRGNLFEDSKSALVLRHGNGCTIEGNYLIGNEDSNGNVMSDLGGIRVIAEDHIVRNNYLKNITGSTHRSAITLARGQSSPALSGYYAMTGVTVTGNTLVNCDYSFNVNYSMASNHTVDISSTTISDNTVYCSSSDYYHAYTEEGSYLDADGLTWSGNEFIGNGLFSSFKTASSALFTPISGSEPAYPAAAIQTIRNQAGCSWDVE